MLVPFKIGPFATGLRYVPDSRNLKNSIPDTIDIGHCLTNADEDPFYSAEELKIRKRNRGEVE